MVFLEFLHLLGELLFEEVYLYSSIARSCLTHHSSIAQ